MVEELKLAIKVDDDAIEQSLLKQFANAEKMANKVVLTFNNIDLDDKAIEAKFKEMQKMAGKNPIDLSIDKSSIEMLSAISKQLGNIFDIAKGKSIIDSSATVSEINKITQATKELNKAQTGSENIQSKSFTTKNKTEAYNQLKQMADLFKNFYGNEEAMHTKAGTEAAYAYYKAYEEALKKGVAQSRLESVTVDADADSFYNANKISSDRIKDFESFKKYGGDITDLSAEILSLEGKLLDFADAYTKVKANLGDAPITPDIIRNIEDYVELLDKARYLESFGDDNDKDIISDHRNSAQFWLDDALFKAKIQNEEYISSLKEVEEEKENVDVTLSKSQIPDMDSSIVEQQNKIQEELKETQKQAEQTSEALSKIGDGNKSNISSGTQIKDVIQGGIEEKSIDTLKAKIKEIFTDTDELKRVLKSLDEGSYFHLDWYKDSELNDFTDVDERIGKLIPLLKEYGYTIKNLNSSSDSLETSGSIVSLADENDKLEKITTSAKEAATSKEKFANANKEVKASADSSTPAINKESDALKSEWDKNVKAIQDYMDAVTKLNNLNAKDKGTGKYASQIALQEKNVEELKEKALEARTAITSMINPHDVPLNTWRDYLDVMKKFNQASLGSAESVAKLEDALRKMDFSSLESAGTKFKSQFDNLSIKPDGDHQFLSWTNDLKELNAKIDEYNSKVKYLKENNIVDDKQVDEVKNLRDEIEETINVMTKTPQAKRGWTDIGASKAAEKVANVLKQNTKMSKEAKDAIRAYYNELRSGNPSQPIDEILVKVNQLVQKERELGRVGKSFGEIFKEKVIYGGAAQLAGMVGFYDVINVIRQAGEAVIDLNTNITELAKVSEASTSQIYDDFNSYADIAKEVGGTISDTISATADWSRNGYNIPDSKELAEVAMIYKNVGDGIDIDQANEYLISTLRGFSLEAKDAMDIIDSINEVANNEPISSAGIGDALQRSAAAFNAANTSLQESIALVTSTNSVLQSPEKVGSMWTTVSARIRGATTELEEAGLETDGMVESTSKLQAMIKGMTGFDILESDGKTFKSIYDIIVGIGDEFQSLSDIDQAALLEALAGKRQSNALAATLNNIDLLKKAYGEATNAEGSAMAEQEKYQQSIQYSIDRTKASLEELANDFISSDFLKGLIDSGDKLINLLDLLIDKFGVLGTTAIVGGGILGIKNLGKTYEYTVFKLNCFEYALYA